MWFGIEWEWDYKPRESLTISLKTVGDVPAEMFPDRECPKKETFIIVPPPSTITSNSKWRFGKDRSELFMLVDGERVAGFSSHDACLDEVHWATMRGTHMLLKAAEKDANPILHIRKVCKISAERCGPVRVDCEVGHEHTDDLETDCRACAPGTYKTPNMTRCVQCPEGSISYGHGSSLCEKCRGNTVTNEQQTRCECRREEERTVLFGTYTWQNVLVGTLGELPCGHDSDENYTVERFARKYCDVISGFDETDFSDCPYDREMVTKRPVEYLADEISASLTVGKNISSEKANDNLEKMDLIFGHYEQDPRKSELSAETSDKYRGAAVSIVTSLVGGSLNSSSLSGTDTIGFVVAEVQGIENKNMLGHSNEFDDEKGGSFSAELKSPKGTVATAVIYQSDTFFPSYLTSKVKISGSSEEKKGVFRDIAEVFNDAEDHSINQAIITFVASVISDINIIDEKSLEVTNSELKENVEMKFEVSDFVEGVYSQTKRKTTVYNRMTCKFYNISIQNWSEEGCTTQISYNKERGSYEVTCSCNHLTSFAVLMSMSNESNEAEEKASSILLGTSLVCLVLTLVATLPIKKQRKVEHVQVNMMLTFSLSLSIVCFFLMDLFVSSDSESEASTPCLIIALLLNYFWLCQLFWMVVEAITMYKALVKVFGSGMDRALLKYCIVGWGVPLVFPLIGLSWSKVSQYADPKTCFVRYPYGLASFYGPVVIAVLIIWFLFFSVARVIMKAMAAKSTQKKESDIAMRRRQLQSAFAVSTLLGLGWIVGFFLLMNNSNYSQINTALRWLFILLNAPQGIFIFVLYAVMNRKIRRYWISKITLGKYADYDTASTGASTSEYNSHGPRPASVALQDNPNHLMSPGEGRSNLAASPAVSRRRHSPCPATRLAPAAHGRRGRSPSPAPNRKPRSEH
ncbi:hypothetical protein ACHWQZ_G017369 [Mnemiopsis leidyi]